VKRKTWNGIISNVLCCHRLLLGRLLAGQKQNQVDQKQKEDGKDAASTTEVLCPQRALCPYFGCDVMQGQRQTSFSEGM
jgi:hypothetical protein